MTTLINYLILMKGKLKALESTF